MRACVVFTYTTLDVYVFPCFVFACGNTVPGTLCTALNHTSNTSPYLFL